MKQILETPRLFLRELTLDDLDFIAEMTADVEVMRYFTNPLTRPQAVEWIERQLDRYARWGYGAWLAVDRATGAPRGRVGLAAQTVDGVEEPEVGYMIHRPFWRQGLAFEAASAVRDYAFTKLDKPYVIALVRPENEPSRGVAHKLGMRPFRRTTFAGLAHDVFHISRT
jgi:RimJ/RimL family protein N-acetyltransferase